MGEGAPGGLPHISHPVGRATTIKRLPTTTAALFIVTACGVDSPASPDVDRIPTAAFAMSDNAAIVIKDGLCGMPGSDADGNLIFGGIGAVSTIVENNNKVSLSCKGEGITNLSERGRNFRGFLCGIGVPSGGFAITDDTHATVSASGQASLTCTYDKDAV